ncbi:MAG: hypothetical protein GTN72_03420 [Candidatus Latescibacteria bacterium]|nr:hypothetical protein [Candidatus Latescibacterota bacterium]
MRFTTSLPLTPPGAATYPATWITTTGANLNGTVNPNGFATEAWFEWGTSSSSLSNRTGKQSMGSGTLSRDIQHTLPGLGQGQTYYYRIAVSSQAGTMKGAVEQFTTDTSDVTLRWQPPTTNVDGSAVDDLAGYRVYYGMSSRNYSHVIDVGNVTSYTVKNLPTGKFYFALTSYDHAGNESGFSAEGYKYIE